MSLPLQLTNSLIAHHLFITFIYRVFDVMETIDDDCDDMDVVFVAVKVGCLMKGSELSIITIIVHCLGQELSGQI